ncbi:MAG: helix-turn-helix domain-containing protein [Nanoarchaeota archaeon]|nr:helix-turn-helix domain-containing protein [Nanoarchaeota archaeon]MBU1623231.1 helix-turn-helix domain-containing protein [Nanoarchaeota archaeon]
MGTFCETYGTTIENRVLEHLLENQDLDIAVGDMAKELDISRPKAYEVIKEFESKEFVVKSRVIGKTQLYKLNKDNIRVKIFLRNFDECLQLIIEEYSGNIPTISAPMNIGVAAKPV